eukprot:jgi/Chlat1/3297/Chrsp22S03540
MPQSGGGSGGGGGGGGVGERRRDRGSADRGWRHGVAGACGGLAAVLVLHPLDVIRTRFQIQDGRAVGPLPTYTGTLHAFRTIVGTEGWRALYSGLGPALAGSGVSWAVYFYWYQRAKLRYQRRLERRESTQSSPHSTHLPAHLHLAAAAEAGALVSVLTNPVWVIKTRLQLQRRSVNNNNNYRGTLDALRRIAAEEGVRGLYRGIVPSLLLVSHGAIQFTVYEELKRMVLTYRQRRSGEAQQKLTSTQETLPSGDAAIVGAASKLVASLFTYPTQVIRARLQQRPVNGHRAYTSVWHTVATTYANEGIRGFYRGMTPNILRTLPAASITFLAYETTLRLLQ